MFSNMAECDRDVGLWNMIDESYVDTRLQEKALHLLSDFHSSELAYRTQTVWVVF